MGQGADEVRRHDRLDPAARDLEVVEVRRTEVAAAPAGAGETEEIQAEIAQTRLEMGETIDAIEQRLQPEHLKEQAKETAREMTEHAVQEVKGRARDTLEQAKDATIGKAEQAMHSAGQTAKEAPATVVDTIKQNPVPAALVGIGLGWLFLNSRGSGGGRSTHRQTYQERHYYPAHRPQQGGGGMGQAIGQAEEQAGRLASQAGDRVGHLANQAGEKAGQLSTQAEEQARRVEDRFRQTLQQNPLALGAIALTLGAAAGLAVPETRQEHEMMGPARDRLVDKTQSMAQDTVEKVRHVAEEAQSTAKEEARQQGLAQ